MTRALGFSSYGWRSKNNINKIKFRWKQLNSYQCGDNNPSCMCTRGHVFVFWLSFAVQLLENRSACTQQCSSPAAGWVERLNPEQLSCLHVELECLWDALPGRCLNLASIGVGKFHENWGKKSVTTTLTYIWEKVPKGDCNWNSCSRWNRSTTRTNSWWPQRDHGPLQITCAVDGAAST